MGKKLLGIAIGLGIVGVASAWAASHDLDIAGLLERRAATAEAVETMTGQDARIERIRTKLDARVAASSSLDVGDPDSFGRPVKWLGMISSPLIVLRPDCTPQPGEPDTMRCVPLASGHAVQEVNDLGHIVLPARSVDSFICHWQSPSMSANMQGMYDEPYGRAYLTMYPVIRIESEVFKDPALIDPETGEPLNGAMDVYLNTAGVDATLAPGARTYLRNTASRVCVGGIINRASLKSYYGLTDEQVRAVFRHPMTLTLRATISARNVLNGYASVGYRFTSD